MNKPGGYIGVDSLQAATSLAAAAKEMWCICRHQGVWAGSPDRLSPFGCVGEHGGRKELAVNTENPQKIWQCHAYQCGCRGNLLTLMHGWLTGLQANG
ncbi:MAG: hypothetical protein U0936_24405 [Planctomycetaceae bacterium]